jgi:Zn-dependent protease/predicted transcriptional regulator
MKWAFRIGRLAGIDLYAHVTFLVFLLWVGLSGFLRTGTVAAGLDGVGFLLAVFATVLLHELAHALVARRFGFTTRDITLLPIGGVARLERMPEKPSQEVLVALAGPAVNLALAGFFFLAFHLQHPRGSVLVSTDLPLEAAPILARMFWVNVSLAIFNLLPAFPMDGGRVLRALLAWRGDFVTATRRAAAFGQALALLFGVVGVFSNPLLVFIALFVWIGAAAEAGAVQMRAAIAGVPVREAMVVPFTTLRANDTLALASSTLLRVEQTDFPVVDDDGILVGVLPRRFLLEGLAARGQDALVADVMKQAPPPAHPREMLDLAIARLREDDGALLPVAENGRLVGIVTMENVGELVMVAEALRRRMPPRGSRHERHIVPVH